MRIIRVGLDVPVDRLFDYHCDDADADDVGRRAFVPFKNKVLVGIVLEVCSTSPLSQHLLKPALRILRDEPSLSKNDLLLLKFASDYYHYPLGMVVINALPSLLRRARALPSAVPETYSLTAAGEAAGSEKLPARATVRRKLFNLFKEQHTVHRASIPAVAATAPAALKQLIDLGWVEPCSPFKIPAVEPIPQNEVALPVLTAEQQKAAQTICADLSAFRPNLLLGVTGSGKTEVYLRAVDATLRNHLQVLLLVPEIALTPQLENTVQTRFPGSALVSLHSGLRETERLANWQAAQSGRAHIVLGTRLAIFAPLPRLGLIIVDEEHDHSYKQLDGLRYSARDLAVVRAQQRGVPIVLGSATPALETFYNAINGRYQLSTLTQRINASPPVIHCVDIQGEKLPDGLSQRLLAAIAMRLERGEQSLVFVNRRGYAPVLMCRACGWLSGCDRCSARLVLHLRDGSLRCHHCGHEERIPQSCPKCGNLELAPLGQGTQRVEDALAEHFPQARILRIDRDSTRRRHAWPDMRHKIRRREVDLLIGTQILAKGHDFPHLSLVGILNADAFLYSSDFRASERLFALLSQVAGRAGRGETRGEVLVQTEFPQHPFYTALRSQDYSAFARALIAERRQAGFPPSVYQALLRAEAHRLRTALDALERAASLGKALSRHVTVYDAVPAGMVRLAGKERAHLLVQSSSRPRLHEFLTVWRAKLVHALPSQVRWSLDVDPMEF